MGNHVNTYELTARANKVDALVDHLDRVAAEVNGRHKRCTVKASDIVEMLCGWGETQWAQAAKEAKVRTPSPITRSKVIQQFQRRVKFS